MKTIPILGFLAVIVAGCTISITNDSSNPTVSVPIIDPTYQVPTLARPTDAPPLPTPVSDIPVLGLTGRIRYTLGTGGIRELNLETGQAREIFQPPPGALITSAATAIDGSQMAAAYAPPPSAGKPQLGYTGIYLLSGSCDSQVQGCAAADLAPFLVAANPNEAYYSPTFSTDGRYLYYAHFLASSAENGSSLKYQLERITLPVGTPEILANDALWPAISADGELFAFVSVAAEDGMNDLLVAAADGTDPRLVLEHGTFYAVDSPFFTPDGQSIIFSAVDQAPIAGTDDSRQWVWLDRLLGAGVAEAAPLAHTVPSDWWIVSVAGGQPQRLTRVFDTGLFGDFSPDGNWVTYLSGSGLYVMRPEGSDITRLIGDSLTGTLNWLP